MASSSRRAHDVVSNSHVIGSVGEFLSKITHAATPRPLAGSKLASEKIWCGMWRQPMERIIMERIIMERLNFLKNLRYQPSVGRKLSSSTGEYAASF